MRRSSTFAGIALAAILGTGAVPAAAQQACGDFVAPPAQGGYATWQLQTKKDTTQMRMAMVGREARGGVDMQWLEMAIRPKKEKDRVVMKFLVPSYPYEVDAIEEIVMQPAGGQPMRISGMMKGMMSKNISKSSDWSAEETCRRLQLVGDEQVSVPAGTFAARHYRDPRTGSDVWVSKSVPFGMVKSVGKDGTIVLTEHGTDAASEITGTPQDMMGGAPGR